MKKIFLALVALFVSSANAGKVFMALVPSGNQFHAVVTITENACTQAEGNALFMLSGKTSVGCWKMDGSQVRFEWRSGDAPQRLPFDAFKLVSDDGQQANSRKTPTSTHLVCTAPGWVSDVIVERDEAGVLTKLLVSGQEVSFSERGTSITFTFNGKNIALSTSTGAFTYETSGFQSFINNQMRRPDVSGSGNCRIGDGVKKF